MPPAAPPKNALARWLDSQRHPRNLRIPFQSLVLFTRQLVTLLYSGVPIVQSLDTLSYQSENPKFGEAVADISHRVSSGSRLSDALTHYPGIFSQIYVVMVRIGEQGGDLDRSLDSLAGWLERDGQMLQRAKSALTYPAFVAVLTTGLTFALFYMVMPAFLGIFSDLGAQLPLITRIVIAITEGVRNPAVWLGGLWLVGAFVHEIRLAWRTPRGRVFLYDLLLHIPMIGGVLYNSSCSRFCAALEALLGSGSDLSRSLKLAATVSGSPIIAQDADHLVASVVLGSQPSDHMYAHPEIYSATMTHMASAGEEASRLPEMLGRASQFHLLEMESSIDALKASIEPLMLGTVACIVAVIVLSIFLPLYGFLDKIG